MRLGTIRRSFSTVDENEQVIRDARVQAARAMGTWTEIENDLVKRGPFLVSASSDCVYLPAPGTIFAPGSGSVVATVNTYHWFCDDEGEVVCLELQPRTWTQMLEAKGRRRR